MNSLSILLAPFIVCFFFTAITDAVHDHEYLIADVSLNCGSTENFAAADGQEWIGDGHQKISSSVQIKGSSTSSSITSGSRVSADQTQYKTVRISRSRFSYAFHLNSGPKFIRLHFNPVPYRGFRRFNDLFTVEAGPFILLRNFSASLTSDALGGNGKSFAKEFCINIEENQRFDIIFYPDQSMQSGDGAYAFINGIEIISVPTHLSYFHGRVQVVDLKSLAQIHNYNHTAFEIIHRQHVKPSDGFVNMFKIRADIPKHKKNELNGITWTIAVDVGFRYLVRIHFCDLGLKIVKEAHLFFEILVNEIRVDYDIQSVEKREDEDFPRHRDYMTTIQGRKQDGKHNLSISIQSTNELIDRNGPLEGFEILKLSNFDNSLASPNPKPPASTPYPTMQNLFKVCGDQNIMATAAVTIIVLVNIFVFKLRQLWENNGIEEEEKQTVGARRLCRRFSLAELEAATQNFNHTFVIGKGGFGKVYKGIINNGQETVAIKRLKYSSNQGPREFWKEIEILSELRHVNLVSLIGYCNEQQEMILVYEYMIHGTLGDHLFKQAMGSNHPSLSWNQCLNICIGAGRGLDYLHTGHGIIHRDVKTSNILLNENFVAKVSDFGLAKTENICELQSHVSTHIKGTHGYFDPYYIRTRELTRKSDIYAYGVVLLEVLCGRPALDPRLEVDQRSLAIWARENISKGNIEKLISSNIRGEVLPNSLKAFVRVAISCLDDEPMKRPTMAQAVLQLEFALGQQEKPNSLVSKETSTARGSQLDAFLQSVISFTKDLEASTSGRNELFNQRRDSLAEDQSTQVKVGELDWETIKAATSEFSYSRIIGEGRGGTFYKAVLPTRQVVAVKQSSSTSGRHFSLENEIFYLCNYKHPNIMKLLRNFIHGEEQILVYEFMEDTSLHAVLFEKREQIPWRLYFKIIIGIARGVCYLQQKKALRIIYSNLEPCNIFLENDMNPKIAIDYCTTKTNMVTSTSYYAPPEGYQANQRYVADIYSFGVIVLEMLSGMKHSHSEQHLDLITLAWNLWDEGRALDLVGATMGAKFSSNEATRCIEISLLCTQFLSQHRPDISFVVGALRGDHKLEDELREARNRIYPPRLARNSNEFNLEVMEAEFRNTL